MILSGVIAIGTAGIVATARPVPPTRPGSLPAPCSMVGYSRAAFGNEPTTSTRKYVLKLAGVPLRDTYTRDLLEPAAAHIDHLVSLADAWRSGACTWTPERRRAFAADRNPTSGARLGASSVRNLAPTLASINEGKGDQGPGTWAPADATARCEYARRYLAVKGAWALKVSAADAAGAAADCR